MTPWMLDLFREQADEAFNQADLPRLRCCVTQLIKHFPNEQALWNALAEALLQSKLWYEAALWCEAWQKHDNSGSAAFFLARIDAQIGLFTQAQQGLQQLPSAWAQRDEFISLLETIKSELQRINQNIGEVSVSLLISSATEYQDDQALLLLAHRLGESVKLSEQECRQIGAAFYRAKQHVSALNFLTKVRQWDEPLTYMLAHSLLMMGDADRCQALLNKQFGKKWLQSAKGIGLALRCADIQKNKKMCLQYLRDAKASAFAEPLFVDALNSWLRSSDQCKVVRDYLTAQQTRLGHCAAYWSALALSSFRSGDAPAIYREHYLKALSLQSDDALLWAKLGATYVSEGSTAPAFDAYQQSLRCDSSIADTWQEFALLANKNGDVDLALTAFKRALVLAPENGVIWSNYGNFLVRRNALQMAVDCGRVAVQYEPKSVTCWNNLAAACLNQHYHLEANAALDHALTLDPTFVSALSNQARASGQLGEFDRSLRLFDAMPNKDVKTCSSMLFYANYHPDLSSEAIYAIYRRIIDQHFPVQHYFHYENELTEQRPLIIGYVSPDFRHHPCYHFISPLIHHRDRKAFRVIAYSNVAVPDAETASLKAACDEWRDVAYCNDEQLAEQIRRDRVDILVDLAGHTNDNRLTLFAHKPAPLQMTWLGFGYTTGLKQIDYFLTDEEMMPQGSEALFAEAPARVPVPCFAYQAPTDVPAVAAAPCLRNGFVTFGSLSRTVRLNQRCLQTWVRLLKRVPNSHLLLNSFSFAEPAMKQRYLDYFARYDISPERLDIDFETPPWPVYDRIDIMLDCLPHNSGTTLFEGLYMGVPFITRRDRVSMGRLGATIARGLGRPEWIANSDDEYIDLAAQMASDLPALAKQRAQLRQQLLHSALCDQNSFCQHVEQVYRQIWADYCARQRCLPEQQQERQNTMKSTA